MNHTELIEDTKEAIDRGDYDRAQALALMAIAERLDRLCEILSARERRW